MKSLTLRLAALFLGLAAVAHAALVLPRVIADHMVLQTGQPAPIWGWATPGETVTVRFGAQQKTAVAATDGKWLVRLDSLPVSATPAELVITTSGLGGGAEPVPAETRTLTDILVGEVWLCSGQSNMEKPLGEQRGQKPVFNAETEIAAANFPQIRLLKVKKVRSDKSVTDVQSDAGWTVCTPTSIDALKFSAAGYFFGRRLHRELNVPIGLIDSTWGGTRIELWTPPEAFGRVPALEDFASAAAKSPGAKVEGTPLSTIYRAMIEPLAPFALRGATWYQGETNLMDLIEETRYVEKMSALVQGWRTIWGSELSFYYVLVAPHLYHVVRPGSVVSPETAARFWEQQAAAQRVIPKSGMIVTTDLVDDLNDIHPRNKLDIGERLARWALSRDYAKTDVVVSGPVLKRAEFAGARAILHFDHLGGGLVAKSRDGKETKQLTWFTVAGADGKIFPGNAVIEGDTVVVTHPRVPAPTVVRFAWDEAAQPNFFNAAGLPAMPFRTDAPPALAPASPKP